MKKINSLMLFALAFLLIGCRNDQITEKEAYNNSSAFQLTSKRISVDESKHKARLLPEIENAETVFKSQAKSFGNTIEYNNGVSINTDDVIYIENGPNYHTYTFNIIRESASADAPVENLLLSPLPDGSYREFLVTYHFTEEEKQALLSGSDVDRTGKMSITELEKGTFGNPLAKSSSCNYETVDVYIPCGQGVHNSGNVGSWGSCKWQSEGFSAPVYYSLVALVCTGGSESPGDGTPPPPGGGSSGGGGSIDGDPPAPPKDPSCEIAPPSNPQPGLVDGNGCPIGIPTQPILSKPFSLIVRNFSGLSPEFYNGLEAFYNANNQSYEAETFVIWASQFSTDNTSVTWPQFESWFLTGDQIFNNNLLQLITQYSYKIPQYNVSDYPGKNQGLPFSWWNDNDYLTNNFSLSIGAFEELTAQEKKLVALFPQVATIIFFNKDIAFSWTQQEFPNVQSAHNNKADAFRHAFFNAINTRDVLGIPFILPANKIVKLFSDAHESEVPLSLFLEKQMDIHNNQIGIDRCNSCTTLTDPNDLVRSYILYYLNNGNLLHIWPLNPDTSIRTDSQLFPTNQH